MEEKATLLESLVEKAENYAKSSADLLKLKAIDKSANILSSVLSSIVISVVVVCLALMVSIGAALWIGELIENIYYGFFIVAAFYLLIAIILSVFKTTLLKMPFRNRIITSIRK